VKVIYINESNIINIIYKALQRKLSDLNDEWLFWLCFQKSSRIHAINFKFLMIIFCNQYEALLNSPIALWYTTVSPQLVAMEAATDTRSNANSIALATVILTFGQTAGTVNIETIALTAMTVVA